MVDWTLRTCLNPSCDGRNQLSCPGGCLTSNTRKGGHSLYPRPQPRDGTKTMEQNFLEAHLRPDATYHLLCNSPQRNQSIHRGCAAPSRKCSSRGHLHGQEHLTGAALAPLLGRLILHPLVGCSLWFCFALVANQCAEPGIFLSFTCWNRKPGPAGTNLKLEFRPGDPKTFPGYSLPVPGYNFCGLFGHSFQFFQWMRKPLLLTR